MKGRAVCLNVSDEGLQCFIGIMSVTGIEGAMLSG